METTNEKMHAIVPLSEEYVEAYRFFRSRGYGATDSMKMASTERRIRHDTSLRVRWVNDDAFDICPEWDAEVATSIKRQLDSGKAVAMGMILERVRRCSDCGHEEWDDVDSLWGIVVDVLDEEAVKREYEGTLEI